MKINLAEKETQDIIRLIRAGWYNRNIISYLQVCPKKVNQVRYHLYRTKNKSKELNYVDKVLSQL